MITMTFPQPLNIGILVFMLSTLLAEPAVAGAAHSNASAATTVSAAADEGHSEDGHSEDDHRNSEGDATQVVALTQGQQALANIRVTTILPAAIDYEIYAPAEITVNLDRSYVLASSAEALVVTRHAELGQQVEAGQPLLSLYSDAAAESQGRYLRQFAEWQRVRALGRSSIGEQRYVAAQTAYRVALSNLLSIGMSREEINALGNAPDALLGHFTLKAKIAGSVLEDNIQPGERVAAGQTLMVVADERRLWAEAQLPPGADLRIGPGTTAILQLGDREYPARISQRVHRIDPRSRTQTLRLEVENPEHQLHPGMFTSLKLRIRSNGKVMAVPEAALLRSPDGDWQVYEQNADGGFVAREVDPGAALGQYREVQGLAPGSRVVVSGAFFVASEAAKSGFDIHNH